jgi:putative Mg2+ transporter-C (MgtC) family protein
MQRAVGAVSKGITMDALIAEFSFVPNLPWPVLVVRLCGTLLLSGLVGLEREKRGRPAGLRTHMLIGLASTVYCMIMLEMTETSYDDSIRIDPVRVIEAVTSGVAFLAAGMIVFSKGHVKGLTTGASMWLVASIGLCVGLGYWPLAIMSTVLALIVSGLLRRMEERYFGE